MGAPTKKRHRSWLGSAVLVCVSAATAYAAPDVSDYDDAAVEAMQRFLSQSHTTAVDDAAEELVASYAYQEVGIDLYWDRIYVGQIVGRLDDCDGLVDLCFGDLLHALRGQLSDDAQQCLCDEQDFEGWLPFCSLERYDPAYDNDLYALFLRTPPHERDTEFVDLNPRPWMDTAGCLPPESVSGFLNYAHILRKSTGGDFSYIIDLDGATCINGWVAEGRLNYDKDRKTPARYNNLRVTHDYPELCTRLTIGEMQSFYPRLLTSDRIQGIQYTTHPILHRNRISHPVTEHNLLLERDSRVEVWVNELQKETLDLPAVTHNIRNFPLATGFNQIRLKIIDDLGRVEYRDFESIHAPELLCPGTSTFTISAGVEGESDRFSDRPILSGSYEYGLHRRLTGHFHSRVDRDHQAAALGGDVALSWGTATADVLASHTDEGIGSGFDVVLDRPSTWVYLTGRLSYRQRYFLQQRETLTSTRTKALYQLSAHSTLPGCLGYLQAIAYRRDRWASTPESKMELSWTNRFADHWSAKALVDYRHFQSPSTNFLVMLAYTNKHWGTTHRHTAEVTRKNATIRNTLGGNNSTRTMYWSAEHQHTVRDSSKPVDNAVISGRYLGDRVHASYYGRWGDLSTRASASQITRLEGSVACIDGNWAFGPPIYNSYAIVVIDDRLADVPFNVSGSGRRKTIETGRSLVVPQLQPFRRNSIRVEANGHSVGVVEPKVFDLAPSHRSGHLLKITYGEGEEGIVMIRGVLHDTDGTPVTLKGLVLMNTDTQERIYSFSDERGHFHAVGLARDSEYEVRMVGGERRSGSAYTANCTGGEQSDIGIVHLVER